MHLQLQFEDFQICVKKSGSYFLCLCANDLYKLQNLYHIGDQALNFLSIL